MLSSIFYFLCCSFGGPFAAILYAIFLSHHSGYLKKIKLLWIFFIFISLSATLFLFYQALQLLVAPYSFHAFLTNSYTTVRVGFLGFLIGSLCLGLHKIFFKLDLRDFHRIDAGLLAMGFGGLVNLGCAGTIYLIFY